MPGKDGEELEDHNALHQAIFRLGRLNVPGVILDMCQTESFIMSIIACHLREETTAEMGVTVSHIVHESRLAPPAVSRCMNSLEEKGIISRSVNKADRRNTLVVLTEFGWKLQRENEEKIHGFLTKIYDRVGADKVDMIISYINEICEVTREELELYKQERNKKE